jgi:hypothetical protein
VALVSVVATVPNRPRQIEAVHLYWRLAEAVADYHFCFECQQRLSRLRAGNDEAAEFRTRQAVAMAELREADLKVTAAQHDLAETLSLASGIPLPLPADQPLVGPYRTLFAELFGGQKAPVRARTLDQTLPLRSRAIESHAAALLAAEDAMDAAIEVQADGQGRMAAVITAMDTRLQQQRAFLAAVCRYNHDIADYALVAVSPQTTPELLVGTLIKQRRPAGQPVVALPTTAVLPATYQPPMVMPSTVLPPAPAFGSLRVSSATANGPTQAASPAGLAQQSPPAASEVKAAGASLPNPPAMVAPPNPLPNNDSGEPRLAPPQESAIPLMPEQPANDPTPHTSRKPVIDTAPPQASSLETYPGLAGLSPGEQAGKLTAALYWTRNVLSPAGEPASLAAVKTSPLHLADFLRHVPANRRTSAIDTYWHARGLAARYQSLIEQKQWLDALGSTLAAQNPPSPIAILVLRAARLAVEAELADAAADWRTADFDLAGRGGGVLWGSDQVLPQAVSVPYVGPIPFPLPSPVSGRGAGGEGKNRPWLLQRLEATLPRQQQTIIDRATVVVDADASRAIATADFLAGRGTLDRVLTAIDIQSRGTAEFLQDVIEYNRAIAQYAVATLPPDTDAGKLVAALMVNGN